MLMSDMNAWVGDVQIDGMVGMWGMSSLNNNSEYLVDICADRVSVAG